MLQMKYYNPKYIIVEHIPVKEKRNKNEVNRRPKCYNIDILTTLDIQVVVKNGGKLIEN